MKRGRGEQDQQQRQKQQRQGKVEDEEKEEAGDGAVAAAEQPKRSKRRRRHSDPPVFAEEEEDFAAAVPVQRPTATKPQQQQSQQSQQQPPPQTPKRVGFQRVEVREFSRLLDGSGGVPFVGAFPLGLSWEYSDSPPLPVADYERAREPLRSPCLMPLPERKRRLLLDAPSGDPAARRAALRTRAEVERIRKSRAQSAGCHCGSGLAGRLIPHCTRDTCPCFQAGMPCIEGVCTCINCHNPIPF